MHASMYGSLGSSLVINLSGTLGTLKDVFKEDFSTLLLLSVISYSDDPDEQLETLNTLISECLERHAPLRKVRVSRPPASWMKDPLIEEPAEETRCC